MESGKKSNKILDIVRLQQIFKKWKKIAATNNTGGGRPKGYLAVCVGRQEDEEGMQRFVIPTEYLGHQAFAILLREAEEEFGFQQEGILKIPCDVPLFHNILKMMQNSSSSNVNVNVNVNGGSCYSPPPHSIA